MNPQRNYYLDLLSPVSASTEELKSAFRRIARHTHSDANQGSEEFRAMFEAAVEAWDVLGDPQKRAAWTLSRQQWLMTIRAGQCEKCGSTVRLALTRRRPYCPLCKTPLSKEQQALGDNPFATPFLESGRRIAESVLGTSQPEAERLSRELVQQGVFLLSKAIVNGFELARSRIGHK